jgi:thioredoxin reductase (NADPH)
MKLLWWTSFRSFGISRDNDNTQRIFLNSIRNLNNTTLIVSQFGERGVKKNLTTHKVKFIFNTQVKEIKGEKIVESLDLIHSDTNSESNLPLQGVFVAIGWKPNTDFLGSLVEKDALGYIKVTDETNTSVKGIFVCGDAADARYRQAITAAGTGAMAAIDCERYLSH